jgi:hypothetical protein
MDFWLATSNPAPTQANGIDSASGNAEETRPDKSGKAGKVKSASKGKSKEEKEGGEKKPKKKKQAQVNENSENTLVDDHVSISEEHAQQEFDLYKPLVANKHLKIVITIAK